MGTGTIRGWAWIHKWSSLVCTLALLILCLTGLPLIFHDEIDSLEGEVALAGPPSARAGLPLDAVVARARDDYARVAHRAGVPLFVG
ncbi:MAG: PepSY domain-containing protein, partial [Proteobacteria bacterium]|nr:PepSY domain-containing protein [Pseudomonadota bacterium]